MLVAAAVCPCPPLLVPEVAAGAAGELDATRAACVDALGVLTAARPDRLVVVGPVTGDEAGAYEPGSVGDLAGFGVPSPTGSFSLGEGPDSGRRLPTSLTLGAWLLHTVSWRAAPVSGWGVDTRLPPADCLLTGQRLVEGDDRVALLVLGDGSACRTMKAPGYLDERAAGFDATAARALGAADTAALADLDATLATELHAAGRASWQVLAGAARDTSLSGELLHDSAPYGVGYLVAAWT